MRNTLHKSKHSVGVRLTPADRRRNGIWFEAATGRQVLALLIAMLLFSSSLLVRVEAAAGDLDLTFDTDGKVKTDFFGGFDGASAVAIQSDGKIVAAGVASNSNFDPILALVRYDPNGNPDPTFGNGGKVMVDFYDYFSLRVDVAIQNDGKIVVVGAVGAFGVQTDFGLARFDTNGNPDPTFGIGGKVTTDFFGNSDEATSVAIQSDGRIVVAGSARGIDFYSDFALARYDTNGNPDGTFGVGGKLTTDFFGMDDGAEGVAIQSDGKIIAAGTVGTGGFASDFGLARYDTNGNPDAAFGAGSKVTADFFDRDEGNSVAIQSDGKIVIAGGVGLTSVITADFGLARYETNGNPDATFGVGGKVTTDFFGGIDFANDVVIQADGKIVAVGGINPDLIEIETRRDFGLARYDTSGNLDPTFGMGGKITTDFSATDWGQGVAIQPDCKIVAAGLSWHVDTGDSDFALARYDSGGCLVALPCPKSQGHWKNNPSIWPVNSLTLGSQSYTKAELLAILNASTQTDASLILARQLIAAKLNIANGSDPAPVNSTVAHADGLLSGFGGKLPYKVRPSSVIGQAMTADGSVLNNYNNALLTPGCNP
jgi:uncharacterized delta-60 repeat protein